MTLLVVQIRSGPRTQAMSTVHDPYLGRQSNIKERDTR